ncbi:hypothetical protein P3X46_024178 [Hevea brasiliensis]|uniref:MADS-box domain-containing protein n=1 Tax=Hevea brasiliensis TaxID=3981 RepID=A0ABQ9L4B9_HEVBR|nr:agamous-like MADS-box protein AGL19 [Hevea brasiliensis]KAJ9158613.1 hypothetical protein P3X46_024178 [Hevea brasiliensis]
MDLSQENPPQGIKKRGRKAKKVPLVDGKEPRKANFIKKIINGDKPTQAKSFDKRKPTLMKKAFELQTLCGVEVCVVCFSPDGKVDVWPEEPIRVRDLILKYKGFGKNEKKESNCLDFLESMRMKLENKKKKMIKEKIDRLISGLSKQLDSLSGDSLMDSVNELEAKIKSFKEKIELLRTEEEKGKAIQADKQLIINTQSSLLDSTSDFIDQDFYQKWQWNGFTNSDTITPNYGSCSDFPDPDLFIQENFDLLSGIFSTENPVNHLEASDNNIILNNDIPFGFPQENSSPDNAQEKFGMVKGQNYSSSSNYNGFLSEALPISVWAPQPL